MDRCQFPDDKKVPTSFTPEPMFSVNLMSSSSALGTTGSPTIPVVVFPDDPAVAGTFPVADALSILQLLPPALAAAPLGRRAAAKVTGMVLEPTMTTALEPTWIRRN